MRALVFLESLGRAHSTANGWGQHGVALFMKVLLSGTVPVEMVHACLFSCWLAALDDIEACSAGTHS